MRSGVEVRADVAGQLRWGRFAHLLTLVSVPRNDHLLRCKERRLYGNVPKVVSDQ